MYGKGAGNESITRPLFRLAQVKYRQSPPETAVMIDHKGKVFQGSYYTVGDVITVSYDKRQIAAPLGKMPPVTLARMMLREMVAGRPGEAATPSRLPQWHRK